MLSPQTIMTGETLDYKKQLALQVGQYMQVHEEDLPRNSQKPRTHGAITLGPTGNAQGGFRFMALNTVKPISRYSWTSLPMPDTVIAGVNWLGRDQPTMLNFTNQKGTPIGKAPAPGPNPEYPDLLDTNEADDTAPVKIPGVDDDVKIPGVDDRLQPEHEAPQIEIDDPDTA